MMNGESPVIAVDFDGTIVENRYPEIGREIPGAINWLKVFQESGIRLILWTVRDGDELSDAYEYLVSRGIKIWDVNTNPGHGSNSLKPYANAYIDDAAIGVPLMGGKGGRRPYVDWSQVGPMTMHRCWPLMQVASGMAVKT
jgi:hypothetical protein